MSSTKPNSPAIPPEVEAEMTPAVRAFVESLLDRIAKLEARLGLNPQNSSLPPSTQHPHAKPASPKRKSKRKRGGQPGHKKHERPLIPTDQCDAVQPLKPTACRRCSEKLIDSGDGQAKRLGYDLRRATCKLFEHWANYRDGTITRAALLRRMAPVRREVDRLLLRGAESGNRRIQGMCRELYDHRQWLWTFLRHEGIEPANNAAERSLRHAAIWRKLSFGTQSAGGSRFVETMLTVIETCRQQRRSAFAFVTDAVEAHLAHQPAASLLSGV